MIGKIREQDMLEKRWELIRKHLDDGGYRENEKQESVHSSTFVSNIAEVVNRIVEKVDEVDINNQDRTEEKKEFDPFDETISMDDEEIQYLKRCIDKCNAKRLKGSQKVYGDGKDVVINISGIEFGTKWRNLEF